MIKEQKMELQPNSDSVADNSHVSPLAKNRLLAAVYSDATHLLICRHCVSRKHCMDYYMHCIPLGKTKNGLMKVIVFGERNWKDKEHIKRIRYVEPYRVVSK